MKTVVCPKCGYEKVPVNGLGRNRRNLPVEKIYDAYQRLKNYNAVGRKFNLPAATVRDVVKRREAEIINAKR